MARPDGLAALQPWQPAAEPGRGARRAGLRGLWYLLVAALSLAYFLTYPLAIGKADESHLLYEAKRVFDGQVPYRDFFESLTPLSLYLFAGIYWIAGVTLRASRVGMALIEALGCALLFHLVRRVAGWAEAALATLIFAVLCIPTWPYASPHWVSTTFGLLVAAVTLAERWQASARGRPLVAGALAGAAACVQQQRGVFLAVWVPLALVVLSAGVPRSTRWRVLAGEIAWAIGGMAVVVLGVLGHAAWRSSLASMADMIFGFAVKNYAATHTSHFPRMGMLPLWAAVLPLTQMYRAATWLWLLRIAPLFAVGEAVILLLGGRRRRERLELERACLCLLAVLMALSIWYLPDFIHVSFVVPFLLIPGASLLHRLRGAPMWARRPAARHAASIGMGIFAVALVYQGVANVFSAYAAAPVRLETSFGAVRADEYMERLFRAVQTHLVHEADGRALLYSYPDDAWLYLTLPVENVTRFSVMEVHFFSPQHVEEVLAALRARRPGTVVMAFSPSFTEPVNGAVEDGYELAEKVGPYHRVYVRRELPHSPPNGPVK